MKRNSRFVSIVLIAMLATQLIFWDAGSALQVWAEDPISTTGAGSGGGAEQVQKEEAAPDGGSGTDSALQAGTLSQEPATPVSASQPEILVGLQMFNGDRSTSSPTSDSIPGNTIYPRYKLSNTGKLQIRLSDIKIRYYYTINGDKAQNFWCDWSDIGSSNVTGTFFKMQEKKKGADSYLEIGFNSGAGTLEPGKSIELHCRIAKTDWTNYDQADDYSFNGTGTAYAGWDKTTVYAAGILVWGVEPGTESPADTTPPSAPQNLSSFSNSSEEIKLSWQASTDDTGVSGYIIYRDGKEIARVDQGTSYTDTGLSPDTSYTYEVVAYDYANNVSPRNSAVSAKTGENINTAIKLQMYNANKANDNNTIFPWYKIYNTGNVPVNLADVKLRYYYTVNGEKQQNFWCDWSSIGSSNVTAAFMRMPAVVDGVDYCLEIGFKSGAGVLKPGESAELQCRIAKTDWTNYRQSDDYSFNPAGSSYTDWNKVTGYIGGKLSWGTEPIAAPQNIKVLPAKKEITLQWDAIPCATSYEVDVDGKLMNNGPSTTYTHTGLVPGTMHAYRVRAMNEIMLSPWSESLTAITLLDQPSNIKKDVTETHIGIAWDAVEGAKGYDLEVDGSLTANGTNTEYLLEGLKAGTMHSIRIRAKGEAIDGEWTELMQIWTLPEVPENIETQVSRTAVTLTWDKVAGASGYDVEVYGTTVDNGAATAYIHTGLEPNTQRTYRIRAKNSSGAGAWSSVVAASTLPGAALNIRVEASADSLKVIWDEQAGATGYEIEIDGSKVLELTDHFYIHTGLEVNSEHSYRVRAKNSKGSSDWSSPATGVVLPFVPGNFAVSSVTSSRIVLRWDAVAGATGYDVEVDGKVVGNLTNTTYVHSPLSPDSQHTYRVRAVNGSTAGAWTQELKASALLPAPANLKAVAAGSEIRLSWDMVVGAGEYELEIDGQHVKAGTNTEYVHTASNAGVKHTYRVRAINGSGAGDWSDTVEKTALLGKPSNIRTASQNDSITLYWDAVDGASAYDVMVDGAVTSSGSSTSFKHGGLQPNTMHTYRVRAVNAECTGEWSNTVSAFTIAGVPGNVKVYATSKEITVTWDDVDGAEGFDIMADSKIVSIGTETVYKHSGLSPNTAHTYRIRARNKNGAGEWSTSITVLTGPAVPAHIKCDVKMDRITLSWDKTEGAVAYEVEADGEIIRDITVESYLSQGLEPNTRHGYRVRAKNKDGAYGEWSEPVEATTADKLIVNAEKDSGFNFVIAVPVKDSTDGYNIKVAYNPDDVEVVDLYAATQKTDLKTGRIEGTGIEIVEFTSGSIVYHVQDAGKATMVIVRLMAKTSGATGMTYEVE